jgi:hypothetical protein
VALTHLIINVVMTSKGYQASMKSLKVLFIVAISFLLSEKAISSNDQGDEFTNRVQDPLFTITNDSGKYLDFVAVYCNGYYQGKKHQNFIRIDGLRHTGSIIKTWEDLEWDGELGRPFNMQASMFREQVRVRLASLLIIESYNNFELYHDFKIRFYRLGSKFKIVSVDGKLKLLDEKSSEVSLHKKLLN